MFGRITISLIFLVALSGFSFRCLAQCPKDPVPLEAFTGVVYIPTQLRFEVASLKVGDVSVFDLFRDPNTIHAAWWKGGYFSPQDRKLMLKSGAELETLREVIKAQGADSLKVSLKDNHLSVWSWIPGLESIYSQDCNIALTSCPKRTELIYTELSQRTQEQLQIEGETTAHLEVNDVFYKLLSDTLKDYMKDLPAPMSSPCLSEIELRKFLDTRGKQGFEARGYQLYPGLKSFLDVLTEAMQDAAKDWSPYHLDVKIIGYTDHNEVGKPIELLTGKTGIDEYVWHSTPYPLEVYYDGCNKSSLIDGPRYLDFSSNAQSNPIKEIVNNCELGAVRAYVATAYLRNKLGTDNVSFSYATGGIARKSIGKTGPVDPDDRRIELEFTMKGARRGVKHIQTSR
jgi:hypothetical protein